MCKWPITQQKHRKVPGASHLGQHLTGHTSITSQTITPSPPHYWHYPFPRFPNSHLTPLHQYQDGGHMYTLVSIQMGEPKCLPTSLHPFPMFPHSSLCISVI